MIPTAKVEKFDCVVEGNDVKVKSMALKSSWELALERTGGKSAAKLTAGQKAKARRTRQGLHRQDRRARVGIEAEDRRRQCRS